MGEIKFTVDENALQVLRDTEITANFTETKAALEELVKPYQGVIVDVSNLRETKADIARIRKVEKSIDDYRKLVKKYVTVPLTVFEDKCKELKAVCTDAVTAMDVQVKEIEQKQKDEKIDSLRLYFDSQEKKYPDFVSFEQVFDEAWENKTFPIEKAQEDIRAYIAEVEKDIDIIKSLQSDDEVALLIRYSENHDLRDAMEYNTLLNEQKKRREQERLIAEERAGEAAEREQAEAERRAKEAFGEELTLPFGMPEELPKEEQSVVIPTKTVRITFRYKGTPSEIARLEEKLMSIGIENYRMDIE